MEHLCRILIIDDESILRQGLKHLCNWEEEGFYIAGEASNGEEALQMIEQIDPHIIITDVVMPVMDGIEFSKTVNALYPDIKVIVLSSFSEFNYVKETLKHGASDYLLKATLTSSDLLEVLKNLRKETAWNAQKNPQIENSSNINNVLIKFLGRQISKDNTEIKLIHQYFKNKYFIMLECNLGFLEYSLDISQNIFEEKTSNLSKHYISHHIYANIFLGNKYITIVNTDDITAAKADINTFARNLKACFPPVVFISSNHFTSADDILKTHRQLTELLPKAFYFPDSDVVFASKLTQPHKALNFDLNLFITNIKNLNLENSYNALQDYFKSIEDHLAVDDYSLKRFCQNIIYSSLNAADDLGFDVSSISNSKIRLFKTIDMAVSFYELKNIVFDVFNQIADLINLQSEQKNSIVVNQIKSYVEENYSNDLSLTEIADQLHINYYYMSSYFKAHTNENLSSYINKVRIEKAKLLLQDKTIPISHISEMVGFSEHNYFSRVFKKHTNLTPTKYRRKVLQ